MEISFKILVSNCGTELRLQETVVMLLYDITSGVIIFLSMKIVFLNSGTE
jgi:hypothetical protein